MRTISDTLLKAQQAGALNPLYKIVLTKGASSYTYENDKILPSEHNEEMYSHRAKIVLNNHNHELDDKDLKGYDAVISYGVVSKAGKEYSPTSPLAVIDQQFDSTPGKLTCTLELEGMPNLMAEDEASESYIPDEDDTKTVKDLVNAIVGATLDCFGHCDVYEVVWDDYDALADTYKPADGFRIYTGGSRLAALRRVLDYTANVPRFEADGKIHILKPVTTGEVYDYEYDLENGHPIFSKAYRNSLVFPNKIIVKSRDDDDPQYSGSAQVDGYDSLPSKVKKTHPVQARLESNDQADDIAEALIVKAEMGCKRGQAEVPLNVGAEVFDYVKVTDQRQGDERTGNLGYVHRRFGPDKWTMIFGFGNWLESLRYNQILKDLETYTDIGNYFPRLKVDSLYAYLDDIQDGPDLYIRQRSLRLDATGVYVTDNTLYAIRLPGEQEHNLWKQDTAPTSPETGDFWIDTNYEPNVVKIWDGDSWEEATTAQLEDFNRGTILRRLKAAALTADGLIVLDQVQEGTYGLVKYTDIQAGHILLSKTTKDGLWYEESGVVLDATYGIALYGGEGINAFRTFATKAHYEAGTPVQVYIGTDGKLYAGGGAVWVDASGVNIEGEALRFFYGGVRKGSIYGTNTALDIVTNNAILRLHGDTHVDIAASSGHVFINASDYIDVSCDIFPNSNNIYDLGSPSKQFHGGYFASRLKIPVGTDLFD